MTLMRVAFVMIALGVAQTAVADVTVSEQTVDQIRQITLENSYLKVQLVPGRGGRIISMIDKRSGQELVAPFSGVGGMLLDMFAEQNYPGEMMNEPYEAEIVESGADQSSVKLQRTAHGGNTLTVHGIRIEKTVTLRKGLAAVGVRYAFVNTTTEPRTVSAWLQQFCLAGPDAGHDVYLRPGPAGIDRAVYPTGAGAVEWFRKPYGGWSAVIDPTVRRGCVFVMEYDRLAMLYNSFGASTVEWFMDPVPLSGRSRFETMVWIVPLDGFDDVSFASSQLVAHTGVQRKDGKLLLRHRLSRPMLRSEGISLVTAVQALGSADATTAPPMRASELGPKPAVFEQALTDLDPDKPLLLKMTLGAGDDAQSWTVLAPDATGAVEAAAKLLTRPPKKQFLAKPKDFAIVRNGVLDVLALHGHGTDRLRLRDLPAHLPPDANVHWAEASWQNERVEVMKLTGFPAVYEELARFDAILASGVSFGMLPAYMQQMLHDYVEAGGQLICVGGTNLSSGWSRPNHALRACSPFSDTRPFAVEKQTQPLALSSVEPGRFDGLPWPNGPTARYVHRFTPQPDAEVLVKAGDLPVLVRRSYGNGSVMMFLAPPLGLDDDGRPYWTWDGWLPFVAAWFDDVPVR